MPTYTGGVKRFDQDLRKFSKKIGVDLGIATRKIAIDLFTSIVRKTPVDTGRARASWNLSAGKPDLSVFPDDTKPDAASTARKVKSLKVPPYSKVFITNNLPYIVPLEEGHSGQAPVGMVKVSMKETRTFLDKALNQV